MDIKAFDLWVRKIIHNRKIDYIRKRKRIWEKETVFEYEEKGWLDSYFIMEVCVNGIAVDIQDGELYQCVLALSESRKQIVLLYYYAGYGDESIGQILTMPKSTVGYNRNRALCELKNRLGGNYAYTGDNRRGNAG